MVRSGYLQVWPLSRPAILLPRRLLDEVPVLPWAVHEVPVLEAVVVAVPRHPVHPSVAVQAGPSVQAFLASVVGPWLEGPRVVPRMPVRVVAGLHMEMGQDLAAPSVAAPWPGAPRVVPRMQAVMLVEVPRTMGRVVARVVARENAFSSPLLPVGDALPLQLQFVLPLLFSTLVCISGIEISSRILEAHN